MEKRKNEARVTRRSFVGIGAAGTAAVAIGCKRDWSDWESLTDAEARTLGAIADQIIPADDFPSASEAGVLTYIDKQLARHYRRHRDSYRKGLAQAEAMSRQHYASALADVPKQQQLEIVTMIERQNRSFFELVRKHAFEGYYGSPRHGGNRNAVSWKMLGLDEPPIRGRAKYDLTKGGPA